MYQQNHGDGILPVSVPEVTFTDSADLAGSELSALREARMRAFAARVAAERALQQAQETEAGLLAQEREVVASAQAAKRGEAKEAARIAAELENEARNRAALIAADLQKASLIKEHAQIAASSVEQSRDEAQRVLERLLASLSEFQEELRTAEAHEHGLADELSAARDQIDEAKRSREDAEAALAALTSGDSARIGSSAPPEEKHSRESPVVDFFSLAAQRAAERRAADAERAKANA